MEWNMRIVNIASENGGEDWYALREVYYHPDGRLMGHADPCTGSDTPEGIVRVMGWFAAALDQPFLHEDDFK